MPIYKISLKPLEPYFFGSEVMSLLGIKTDYYQRSAVSYYQRSAVWPQQSALTGFLRHQLLIQNNCIPLNKENQQTADSLIGPRSFQPEATEEFDLGKILKIYPLLIQKEHEGKQTIYYQSSKRIAKQNGERLEVLPHTVLENVQFSTLFGREAASPLRRLKFKDKQDGNEPKIYTAKAYFKDYLIPFGADTDQALDLEDIVFELEKPGVQKNRAGKNFWAHEDKKEGYFKFVYNNFGTKKKLVLINEEEVKVNDPSDEWSFVTWVQLSDDDSLKLGKQVVQFGAERSSFMMHVQSLNEPLTQEFNLLAEGNSLEGIDNTDNDKLYRVTLLADTFVEDESYSTLCDIALTDRVHFRSMKTQNSEMKYYGKPDLSSIYWLLKRGSILYVSAVNLAELHTLLTSSTGQVSNFAKIGYNALFIEQL